jgi:hypothetical protein
VYTKDYMADWDAHSYLDTIVGEDEGSVRGGELGVRHFGCVWSDKLRIWLFSSTLDIAAGKSALWVGWDWCGVAQMGFERRTEKPPTLNRSLVSWPRKAQVRGSD